MTEISHADQKAEQKYADLTPECCLVAEASASSSQLVYDSVPLLHGAVLEVAVKSKKTVLAETVISLDEDLLDKEMWFTLKSYLSKSEFFV